MSNKTTYVMYGITGVLAIVGASMAYTINDKTNTISELSTQVDQLNTQTTQLNSKFNDINKDNQYLRDQINATTQKEQKTASVFDQFDVAYKNYHSILDRMKDTTVKCKYVSQTDTAAINRCVADFKSEFRDLKASGDTFTTFITENKRVLDGEKDRYWTSQFIQDVAANNADIAAAEEILNQFSNPTMTSNTNF